MESFDTAMAQVFGPNWKSTFSAYLTIFFTVGGFATTYLAMIQNPRPWEVAVAGGLTSAVGLAKLVVGHLTVDAGTTLAVTPGTPVPEPVASHETPNDPNAKAVSK